MGRMTGKQQDDGSAFTRRGTFVERDGFSLDMAVVPLALGRQHASLVVDPGVDA
jgi:hypothetical protein